MRVLCEVAHRPANIATALWTGSSLFTSEDARIAATQCYQARSFQSSAAPCTRIRGALDIFWRFSHVFTWCWGLIITAMAMLDLD